MRLRLERDTSVARRRKRIGVHAEIGADVEEDARRSPPKIRLVEAADLPVFPPAPIRRRSPGIRLARVGKRRVDRHDERRPADMRPPEKWSLQPRRVIHKRDKIADAEVAPPIQGNVADALVDAVQDAPAHPQAEHLCGDGSEGWLCRSGAARDDTTDVIQDRHGT